MGYSINRNQYQLGIRINLSHYDVIYTQEVYFSNYIINFDLNSKTMKRPQRMISLINEQKQLLTEKILPQSQQISTILSEFHEKQCKEFEQIENGLNSVINNFKSEYQECQANVNEIDTEWAKIKKFSDTGKGYLNAKSQQINSKKKNIEAVSTGIKETVSKVDPLKLSKLPVDKSKPLQTLFTTLYSVLYHQKKSEFDWSKFKKLALKHEQGEDFVFRLVNINFKDLNPEEYEQLLILKNDPEFQNACLNSEYAYDIIDMADWVEYVCVGHQFSEQRKAAEKEYEKIRRDMGKKSEVSLKHSKQFWKEALTQIDKFQSNLVNLESELKTLKIGAQNSLDTIKEETEWRNAKIEKLNTLMH